MANGRQLRLLLWKDYLMRKRKLVTLLGIIWATAAMSSLYLVRINVDNEDYPTCGFPARALPSAGVLPFLQSFICGMDNVCSPLDQYDEVPTYENSTLTKLQHKLAPIMNETVLELAGTMPNAIKVLATLADVVDEPAFVHFSKNGLQVRELFTNPSRVKRSLSSRLNLDHDTSQSLMDAKINFEGLVKGNIRQCNIDTIKGTLIINNTEHLQTIAEKICSLSKEEMQKLITEVIFEVDWNKYLTMLGNMYQKLAGDDRLKTLGDLLTAVIRMMNLQHFLPPELVSIFQGENVDFSYVQLNLVPKLIEQFEPTFGTTESYQTIRDVANTFVVGLQYMDKIFATLKPDDEETKVNKENGTLQSISIALHKAVDIVEVSMKNESVDTFNVLSQIMNFIYKFLPDNTKHDVLFYSTLLAKLLEGAQRVVDINMHIEHLAYNVTLRNPAAVNVLKELPPSVIGKALEALSDAGRIQVLTSKINTPGSMFCDLYKIQTFFVVSKEEAEFIKVQLCNDVWKNYIKDLVMSFGVADVKTNINAMASLLIQETLGKDTSNQLYTIDKDFKVLKNFSQSLVRIQKEITSQVKWNTLFNLTEGSELRKVVREKGHLGKQILIVIHGALAKEIVKQNTILDLKLSPYLNDIIIIVSAINEQLSQTPRELTENLKQLYPYMVKMILMTALNEKKTYAALSTPGTDMMCNGVDYAGQYLDFPEDAPLDLMVDTLCNTTVTIEEGMNAEAPLSKAIRTIKNSSHAVVTLDWNKLINNVKDLYVKLEKGYTYLFKYSNFGMTEDVKKDVDTLYIDAKEYWFGVSNMQRTLRLSVKLGLRFLDLLDYGLFDVTGELWTKIKQTIATVAKPVVAFDQVYRVVATLLTNDTYKYSGEMTSLRALNNIVPGIPRLVVDAVDVIERDDTDVQQIISLLNADPPWPCADGSLADILKLSNSSITAVQWVETLLCLENEVRDEWTLYLNNATYLDANYPHLFLTLSSTFDLIIDDITITTNTIELLAQDSTDGSVGIKEAWNYAVTVLNTTEKDDILVKLFTKVDLVISSISTPPHNGSVYSLWESYLSCSTGSDCKPLSRTTWKYFLESASLILENVVGDLLTYFQEINDPNSNLLQYVGFTKNTGLYVLYDKMPEFLGVLLNSYWDYGFMSQVRRASMSEFWDCEALLSSLVPPPDSPIDSVLIDKVRPYICPSLLHWLSIPVGDNILLDVIAKPQYYFYTIPVQNLSSRYEKAYTKAIELGDYLTALSKNNTIVPKEEDAKINSIKAKLTNAVDKVLTFKIDRNDPKYRLFNEINAKQFAAFLYLTKIVAIVSKLNEEIQNLDANKLNTEGDIEKDLETIKFLYKRKPVDAILIHFDLITDIVLRNNDSYGFVNALDTMCEYLNKDKSKRVLLNEDKVITQICSKQYQGVYTAVQDGIVEDYVQARSSLMNLLKILQYEGNETDVFEFLRKRKQLLTSLTTSIKHSYDLSIPIYLKYLQSNIQSYDVIVSFLAGEDWWTELKALYNGPHVAKFFGYVERSFEVAEELLTNFDQIHLVRLLHDIDLNQTNSFCLPNVTLSDYFPDSSGVLSQLKKEACDVDKVELFRELPPLLYASQGYENSLKLSKDVNYTAISNDITKTESRLALIADGPKEPLHPGFVTDEKVEKLRTVALKLASKESLTKASFALLSNIVDATTLFLNNSQCTVCSQFTTWLKQLNLQLFKKQEYDNLFCQLDSLTLDEVYITLKNDFHWDMVIKELISTRNYTKYEMNKSINEFLNQVKGHLLEDMAANTTKLTQCLNNNVDRNELGNVTLLISVLARTAKLFRAALPHLHEIEGIQDIAFLNQLSSQITQNIHILRPLTQFLNSNSDLHHDLHHYVDRHDIVFYIQDAAVDLNKILTNTSVDQYLHVSQSNWSYICSQYDCNGIASIIVRNVNNTLIRSTLPKLQTEEFWGFTFISNILEHIEKLLSHSIRIFGVASKLDIAGLVESRLEALVDMALLFINEEVLDSVVHSVEGLVEELHPILKGTPLEHDLKALSSGLLVVWQLKNYLLEEVNLKIPVQQVFPDGEAVEARLTALGINNTNFWSLAAPRIQTGYLNLKPLLTSKLDDCHISKYTCDTDYMSKVVLPSDLSVVTSEEVLVSVMEQLCALTDDSSKQLLSVLLDSFNYTVVLDKVSNILLTKLYAASNITASEGATVLARFPQMAALLPTIQDKVSDVTKMFADEPVFKSLGSFDSIGGLLSSSEVMSGVGHMVCGRALSAGTSRFYKNIAALPDMSSNADQAQLDVLPTDFCRTMYQEIINQEGGKIVWSFVKPLVMGKILYTPHTATVDRIMEKANTTFATMIKLTNLVHQFASSVPSISSLSSHPSGVSALQNMMTEPQLRVFREMIVGEGEIQVDGVFDLGDMKDITQLLTKASQLLQCINLNRLQPVTNEDILTKKAAELSIVNEFTAGVVFLNADSKYNSLSNVEYKIRMDIDNAPTTTRLKDYLWIPGPEANFIENMRYFRGFVQIQDMVDSAIIQLSSRRSKREVPGREDKWAVYTQQTPYPCYRKDYYQTSLYDSQSLILAFFFSLMFTVASAVRFIVIDKETGNTMLMSVMGVDLRWHTLSWFMTSLVEMVVTCLCLTLVLHFGGVLPHTDVTLLFVLLFIYSLSLLSYCYLFSKLFTSASLAAVCGAIIYLMTFMPYIIILSLEAVLSSSLKYFICLSMSSSLCYSFLYITRYEASGSGASWSDVWSSPDQDQDMCIGVAALFILLDAGIYFVIGWVIDRYFGIQTLTSNITHCTTTDEKAGVSILNITKIYQEGSRRARLALDNVSMELHKGQITTLLGHNGAGKTTLINILMGMLRPTRGHITVRAERGASRLGVCPQRDVLLDHMTAREHVALYAQLKSGLTGHQVEEEVDRMLQVLSLGAYSSVPVSRLSGGTRRRVCVALAFVGQPHLVSLDEPTAGVDPAARRDIWSMIVKLKEDRTILLTTHHLDEAELLSDQIVIMHKGQIHTTGSPIEIKRSLGNGYRLTVTYPQREPWDTQEPGQDEKTKQLLSVVRDSVNNANVVEIDGLGVEIDLPFFSATGLHNNYLQLCLALEASQGALGFTRYSLECSSLEHVFHNICVQADSPTNGIEYLPEEAPSKSVSTSSLRLEHSSQSLLSPDGPLTGSGGRQLLALLRVRWLHHIRNRYLLFILFGLPTIFTLFAMGFSMIRPPPDEEVPLRLDQQLYGNTTEFIVPYPSISSSHVDAGLAERVLQYLMMDKHTRNYSSEDTLQCECTETRQVCAKPTNMSLPEMLALPDVGTLNSWLVDTQQVYIEKRYGGFSSSLKNNLTNLISWYNNKGHHALPSYLNTLNSAILRAISNVPTANITTYTHPLKISTEPITKTTVYQHMADAGIAGLILVAYSLVTGGGAIYVVASRTSQEKRLALLSGVSPLMYWNVALLWHMLTIVINLCISVVLMSAFGFPVFMERNNLPAICVLILLYGFAGANIVHVLEKLFSDASLANMMLFCGNAFVGLALIVVIFILDIISQSDATDYARYVLHKMFILAPPFALADGMLEIAKNTIQAKILIRFGMDTYKDPFNSSLVLYHYISLIVVGTALMLLNLAIEYDCFEIILKRFRSSSIPAAPRGEAEAPEVTAERTRVTLDQQHAHIPLGVNTLGNINRGYVHTEGKNRSLQSISPSCDVLQCINLSRTYGNHVALRDLTLGIRPGECTALLGQNGAGKSTTFSLLTGELRPSAGHIYLRGARVKPTDLGKGLISYCPQSDAIDPLLTVKEILQYYCTLRGIDNENEVMKRTIDMFELNRYTDVRTMALSGGNKRKLCTAVAFMARSALVLLDEPTSGMDVVSRACVWRGVRACPARAVLLCTHALHDAAHAHRVALLHAARLRGLSSTDCCLTRFGRGYVVQCACVCARAAWARLRARAPHARRRLLHARTLHALIPMTAIVDGKEVTTRLSDVFLLMAELQGTCDIEDYTINQSSLEEMFLSLTDNAELEDTEVEPALYTHEQDIVTAL